MNSHRRQLSAWSLILLSILAGMSSFAQISTNPPLSLDDLQQDKESQKKIDQLQDLEQSLGRLQVDMDRVTRDKYLACMQAFGSESFCACLRDESPIGATFADYVKIVTSTKEELGYDKLDKESKSVVDKVLAVREHCVAQLAVTPTGATNKQAEATSPSSQKATGHFVPDKPEK